MRICVLNGSPKGKYSVTLHTSLYLEKLFPECEFETVNIGSKIKQYERDISVPLAAIEKADLVVFSYPVYTFIAPYQMHRFIELLFERGADFTGKCAVQISTSKHFYDVTAHNYIKENVRELGFRYLGGLSADMDDILTEKGREEAEAFFRYALFSLESGLGDEPIVKTEKISSPYSPAFIASSKKDGFDTVIVTNMEPDDLNLGAMIEDFRAVYPYKTRVVNIAEYPFIGGCLGCFNCATDGKCIYKDGFDTFLREEIQTAKSIVYAFSIKEHSMGASFKLYDDRQFCNGHRTVTMGMPMGYIVNGDLDMEPNLKNIIEARCDVGHNFYAGAATDSHEIGKLSGRLVYALENKLSLPQSFWGVGGLKIFRDLIYLMRGMMKADHKFYKKHGFYDFPQKKRSTVFKMKLVGLLIGNKKIKAKLGNKLNEGMISPYKKMLEAYERDTEKKKRRAAKAERKKAKKNK